MDGAPRRAGARYAVGNTVLAVLILLLAAPVLLAVAIAVKLDGGPVFFRQTRVGHEGRHFQMIKFRSMVVDAEAKLADLVQHNEGAGPLFKMTRDPRITRVRRRHDGAGRAPSIRLDAIYVDTWSPALDATILFRTIGAVLRGGGAY